VIELPAPSPDETPRSRFLSAAGATGPLRVGRRLKGAEAEEVVELDRPFVVVGRDPDSDLVLDHGDVSRRHAYLQLVGGRVVCFDLQSRTGTSWRPSRAGEGPPGPVFQVGPFRLRPLATADVEPTPAPIDPPPAFSLEPEGSAPWSPTADVALIGRATACTLRLDGPGVSKVHAGLVWTPEGPWVVDLLAAEGVLLDGSPIRCALLDDGDELRIGPRRLLVRLDAGPRGGPRLIEPTSRPLGPAPSKALRRVAPRPRAATAEVLTGRSEVSDELLAALVREFGRSQQDMAAQFQQAIVAVCRMFAGMHQEQMSLLRDELDQLRQAQSPPPALPAAGSPPSNETPPPKPRPKVPEPPPLTEPIPDAPDDIHLWLARKVQDIQDEGQGRWRKILNNLAGKEKDGP
jgi:pSer/pThr/pTyr-binding forkhead associated (FHA) protein